MGMRELREVGAKDRGERWKRIATKGGGWETRFKRDGIRDKKAYGPSVAYFSFIFSSKQVEEELEGKGGWEVSFFILEDE